MEKLYFGSCHCGGVKFRVVAPIGFTAIRCNCSICSLSGYLHLHVKNEALEVLSGQHLLSEYRFNSRIAEHMFCKICGIKPFYRPRSHPLDFSINVNCLADVSESDYQVLSFDGKNWEDNISAFPDQPVSHD